MVWLILLSHGLISVETEAGFDLVVESWCAFYCVMICLGHVWLDLFLFRTAWFAFAAVMY